MCRRTGLEKKRRCGWLPVSPEASARPVWVRGTVSASTCPKSLISAESLSLVEEYFVRRRLGSIRVEGLSARQVEAFLILEKEIQTEKTNEQHHPGHSLEDFPRDLG